MAPQAIVMKRQGKIGFLATKASTPNQLVFRLLFAISLQSSGKSGILTKSPTIRAPAINKREMANRGYILPIILSIGRSVATI